MNKVKCWLLNDLISAESKPSVCFCVGPKNGEPLCPCRMRNVTIRDGRYVKVEDLGPAPERKLNRNERRK